MNTRWIWLYEDIGKNIGIPWKKNAGLNKQAESTRKERSFFFLNRKTLLLYAKFGVELGKWKTFVNNFEKDELAKIQKIGSGISVFIGHRKQAGNRSSSRMRNPYSPFIDPASGGSEDWAKGRMGVKYSYLFELRPEEQVWDGFLLAENQVLYSLFYALWKSCKRWASKNMQIYDFSLSLLSPLSSS